MKTNTAPTSMPTQSLTMAMANSARRNSPLISAAFAGLVLSSVSVVAQAAPQLDKPAYTLKIVTHGEDANRSHNMDEQARQDNRRTDVSMKTTVQTGTRTVKSERTEQVKVKVNSGQSRSIRLDDGGVIWVSKDPISLNPTLNVNTSGSVEIEGGTFSSPINFTINTNYAHYIDQWELAVYDSSDTDQLDALATFMGRDLKNGRTIKWDGHTKDGQLLKSGDQLTYVLTVRDKEGHKDETHSRQISLIGANRNLQNSTQTSLAKKAVEESTATKNNDIVASFENNLKLQTIPVHGSRVRIFGRDIAQGNKLSIDGEDISLVDNKFVIEKLLPTGQHEFDVAITDNAQQVFHKPLDVNLKEKYMFMVGLADVTVGSGKVTGNLESLSDGDKHLDGDIFVDGRVAFYLKGKIQGKYLVTAQMDTGTAAIDELFDDIHKKDPRSLFRRLDPDKYYPVYGDDSTIIDDTDSQGKMFVRVDWDKSRALWGNYNTDLTGTELSAFNRSLYGAKLNHRSTKVTTNGNHKTDITVFGSEAQSAFRHNQFIGTGGSLYYLKDTDIVDGSEKVWVEIRQRNSERAVQKVVLEEGRDYQIDDFQGRIILHRPLLQIAQQSGPSLIKDTPLDGNQVFLMVDYEYVPDNFASDKASYGAQGKAWVTDNVAIGATFVHENRDKDDYDLKGVDVTYQKGKGTYIKGEFAQSEATQTHGSFLSQDGGLNFSSFADTSTTLNNNSGVNKQGSAYSIETRVNLLEFSRTQGSIGAWFKNREAGFSTSRFDNGHDTVDAGVEAIAKLTDSLDVSTRVTLLDKEDTLKTTTASVQADYKVSDKLSVAAEVRHVKEDDQGIAGNNLNNNTTNTTNTNTRDGEGTLAALKVGYDVRPEVNVYAVAQGTLATKGNYQDNNLFTVGTKARVSNKLDLNAELSTGDRGDAATLGANYRVSDGYSLYTNYTLSTDRTTSSRGKRNVFTVGQRKSISNQLKVYTEHQFTHEDTQSGVGHTFGLDYQISKELTANASIQTARLDKAQTGLTDRDAFSVGLGYRKDKTDASTRFEYRRDTGENEDTEQYVTTNRANYRMSPSLRLQGKFNYSETKDQRGNTRNARFTEAAIGFALRPVSNDRLNILGKLSYLYDLQPLSQSTRPDERAVIGSVETNYQIDQKWEIGGKLAHKQSEIRDDRSTGKWQKNDASLAAVRARYHLTKKWDAMAEYHWMNSDQSQDMQHGAMVSVDRHIGKNMKLGIGYNFTDFTDDLRDTDGTAEGWFVNIVGKY